MNEPSRRNRRTLIDYLVSKVDLKANFQEFETLAWIKNVDFSCYNNILFYKWCFEDRFLKDSRFAEFRMNFLDSDLGVLLVSSFCEKIVGHEVPIEKNIIKLHDEVLRANFLTLDINEFDNFISNGKESIGRNKFIQISQYGENPNIWFEFIGENSQVYAGLTDKLIRVLVDSVFEGDVLAISKIKSIVSNKVKRRNIEPVNFTLNSNSAFSLNWRMYLRALRKSGCSVGNSQISAGELLSAIIFLNSFEQLMFDVVTVYAIVNLSTSIPILPSLDIDRFTNRQILSAVRIPSNTSFFNHSRVYLIGTFDKRITVYNEQVRALRIVRSIIQSGVADISNNIAIVGGGIAGVSAAMAFVSKGYKVTLFEKGEQLLNCQEYAGHRFIHPHIFSWPSVGSNWIHAGVPIKELEWKGGYASEVVQNIRENILAYVSTNSNFQFHLNCMVSNIRANENGGVLLCVNRNASNLLEFDSVVYAIGFGSDKSSFVDSFGYWEPDGIMAVSNHSTLVSGRGDGAFIDAIRVAITDFDHQSLIEMFSSNLELTRLGVDILKLDELSRKFDILVKKYSLFDECLKLNIPEELLILFRGMVAENCRVSILHRNADPFRNETAIINRAVLLILKSIGVVDFIQGELIKVEKRSLNEYYVEYKQLDNSVLNKVYNRVVARHGPQITENLKESLPTPLLTSIEQLGGIIAALGITDKLDDETDAFFLN